MTKGKLGTTDIPTQDKSLTAIFAAASWKSIPVSVPKNPPVSHESGYKKTSQEVVYEKRVF